MKNGWAALCSPPGKQLLRRLLFVYALMLVCPIRFWPVDGTIDNTWVFALNYAAAHGLVQGRDVIGTTGPLGYLVFPQRMGHNLEQALIFQLIAWVAMAAILWDLFFRRGVPLRNLGFWTAFLGLSAPLFWFNYTGLENILLVGLLVLLGIARQRASQAHFVAGLALAGVMPLIKLTAGMLAAGAIGGYLLDLAMRRKAAAWKSFAWAAILPAAVFGLGCMSTLPSWEAFHQYCQGSLEVAAGYSSALSLTGDPFHFGAVIEILVWLGVLLFYVARAGRQTGVFLIAFLAVPLFASFKHGFVRQDYHVLNFICFSAVAIGTTLLFAPLTGRLKGLAILSLIGFGVIWLEYVGTQADVETAFAEASGIRPLKFLWSLREVQSAAASTLDPSIRLIVQDSPVAFLSVSYSTAVDDRMNLKIPPLPQMCGAYTPYLDNRNASWIESQGPRFLIDDGSAIDGRHPWAQSPATWLEIYRWYDTRLLAGPRSLLLERRAKARFGRLVAMRSFELPIRDTLYLDATQAFWTYRCPPSAEGRLRKLFFRVPEVSMTVEHVGLRSGVSRVVMEVLTAPVPGSHLPDSLEELAALLDPRGRVQPVEGEGLTKVRLGGEGLASYAPACHVEVFDQVP